MNDSTRDAIDELIDKQLNKLESRLFGLKNISKIVKIVSQFETLKKNPADLKLYEKLRAILENSIYAKWTGLITAWSHQTLLFKKTTSANEKKQAPRKPYVYETHKFTYDKPHTYFQADLADMNSFNLNFGYHPEFCLVLVDGVSGKVYLRVTGKKNANKVLASFKEIFKDIQRPSDKNFIYLQTDYGGEFFNNKMSQWCEEENIYHFHSKNYGKAYMAESVIGRLKLLYQKLRNQGKLKKRNWSFYIETIEQKLNEAEKSTSGISPEELDGDDAEAKALRMFDQFASDRIRKNKFASGYSHRVEKEYNNQKLKIYKPLTVGTECYLKKYKIDAKDTFSKSSTRNRPYWDTTKKVIVMKVTERSNPIAQGYLPVHIYKVGEVDHLNATYKVKREDLLPIDERDEDIYYKNFKEYSKAFYKPLKKTLQEKKK